MGATQEPRIEAQAPGATARSTPSAEGVHELRDFPLQSGEILPSLRIAWKSFGRLNAGASNVILYPTSFGAKDEDIEWLVHERVLDPERYFIVILNLTGNGKSTSPSHFPEATSFPGISVYDNVYAQHLTVEALFGVREVEMVYGWSMGGMQAYHWATAFPELVRRIVVVCGSARCATHNYVFLEGVKATLQTDPDFRDGWFHGPARRGLAAMARVYAGWALSQSWYREQKWAEGGYTSLEDFLQRSWVEPFSQRDPNNVCAQIRTWQEADVGRHPAYGGNWQAALLGIQASVLLVPGETDLYFRVRDNELEAEHLRNVTMTPIPSIWGHRAGNPRHGGADLAFIRAAVARHLAVG